MKEGLLLVIFLMISVSMSAQHGIDLKSGSVPTPGEQTNPRSSDNAVIASITNNIMVVSFCELTESQIIVTDSTNMIVFSRNYTPAYSVQANLTPLSIGDYVVEIYAFDEWWIGEFEVE